MVYVSAKTFMVENFGWYIGDNQTAKFFCVLPKFCCTSSISATVIVH